MTHSISHPMQSSRQPAGLRRPATALAVHDRGARRTGAPACATSSRARSNRTSMRGRPPARFRMRCTSRLRGQGLLGVGFPERLGGNTEDADPYYRVIFCRRNAPARRRRRVRRPGDALDRPAAGRAVRLRGTAGNGRAPGARGQAPHRVRRHRAVAAAPMPVRCRRARNDATITGSSTARRR